jgi:Methyltransferase domain
MRTLFGQLADSRKHNRIVRGVGIPVRNAARQMASSVARRLGDPATRLGNTLGDQYPQLLNDPEVAVTYISAADRMYRAGVFDLTETVDEWAVFARHAPPGHYYSPIPSYGEVLSRADRIFDIFPDSLPGIDLNEKQQEALFLELTDILKDEDIPLEPDPSWRYCGANGYYGIADGLVLHGMLRWLRPRRIVEVGSGWTSALILDTSDRFLEGDERLAFIEPYPDRLADLLRGTDTDRVRIHEAPVQRVPPEVFSQLGSGDLLFIDSSHVVTIGSDVPYLVGEVLPTLPSGVVVHVHDIFWPFEIPRPWFEEGRLWAEPYIWRAFLTSNADWEIIFFNHWFVNARRSVVRRQLPRMMSGGTGSLWLRRR